MIGSFTEALAQKPKAAALYGCFFVGCLVVYLGLDGRQNGAFDYLLTLSAALQALAFAVLVFDSASNVNEGLSEKTLWAFIIAHVARISTTFWGQGYVPEDNTSDVFLYQTLEVTSVLLLIFHLLKLAATRSQTDVGQGLEKWSLLIGMVVASLVLSSFTKSTGHNDYWADLNWMFSVWLEAMALAPQVWLLLSVGQIDDSVAHFGGLTLTGSVVFAMFWGRVARDRYSEFQKDGEHIFFIGILAAAFIRVGLCSIYVYLFFKTTQSKGGYSLGGRPHYELVGTDEL